MRISLLLEVWRWRRQYAAQLNGPPLPEMQRLIEWLEAHIPPSDADPQVTCIAHGDYRSTPHKFFSPLTKLLPARRVYERHVWLASCTEEDTK